MPENNLPMCGHFRKCGGCQLQNLPYEKQLGLKTGRVIRLCGKFCHVNDIIGMEDPYYYRNKVQAAFGYDGHGNIISGTYEADSHKIVSVTSCQLEDQKADEIINFIRNSMKSFRLTPYDSDRDTGIIRHVLVKRGFSTGEIMVVIVTGSKVLPSANNLSRLLVEKFPEIRTVIHNINPGKTNLVLGKSERILYGPGYITDRLCGLNFAVSSSSFYQINPVQTEKLYRTAIKLAGLNQKSTVIDAYCGVGAIGLIAARHSGKVYGVELNRSAVTAARKNASENRIQNITFVCDDAGKFMHALARRGQKTDVVFMDPPRSGASVEFINALKTMRPQKIVYISCNPATLARDLEMLKKCYEIRVVQPVDMFPFTDHVETVCLLSKLSEAKHSIDVKLDMDELDVTSAETKATYEEIKAYVLEQTGLQVSSLYIAQVKRECGIIERENYNKPKAEDAKQPQCPEEKKKAIEEALKHFGMI